MKIAIVGGGLTGLTAAYYLSKTKKYKVYLYEKNSDLGGLLGIFTINGVGLEGYYHHLAISDKDIISLIKELSLGERLLYLTSKVGIFYEKKIYPFSTPLDLLSFPAVSFLTRIRLGLATLYLQKIITIKNWQVLRNIPAQKWFRKAVGEQGFKVIWKPLLKGKFGHHYANKISMAWLWFRIHWRGNSRSKGFQEEQLVYLEGGFKILVDALARQIKNNGGEIYLNSSVKKIKQGKNKISLTLENGETNIVDKCIVTVPNPVFAEITPDLLKANKKRLLKVKYRAAMVMVLRLKKPFMEKIYWLNIHEENSPLLAVVEQTNFVNPRMYGGESILYAGNYPDQNDPIMQMDEELIVDLVSKELKKINPEFKRDWITNYWLFRDKFAQPIVTTDYHTYIPPVKTGIKNLYLANMAQVYPEDRGANQAVRDGKNIAQKIIDNTL